MNYMEAMDYIENTAKFGMNLGLQRIEALLSNIGNPEKKLRCIHIAGTNGKGSVTSMISRILMEDGFKVGIYTSPYLQRFTERIKINNKEISCDCLARLVALIKPAVDKIIDEGFEHPTEFEIITAVMFKYFEEEKVDFAVLEVGLGGRLDSTNVIDPLLSVITTISYDHMAILGDTLGKIAYEKAGIIKENGIVVTYPQKREAMDVIESTCREKNAALINAGNGEALLKSYSLDGQVFDMKVEDETYECLSMKLLGEYQLLNALTAVTAIRALSRRNIDISRRSIYAGLKNVRWPGRIEVISKNPLTVIDGAHNVQGIQSLREALDKYFHYNKLILVTGMLKDKQVDRMCEIIMPLCTSIIATEPLSPRAMSADELCSIARMYCGDTVSCPDIEDACNTGLRKTDKGDLLLFCGSLYMIGMVRTITGLK